MHINLIGKFFELELHCFCLFDAYSMPKDSYSEGKRQCCPSFFFESDVKSIESHNH